MDNSPQSCRTLPPLFVVVTATAAVALLPSLAAWGLRVAGVLPAVPAILAAGLISLLLSYFGQRWWERRRRSSEALFSDLMVWGWVRRKRIDRRLNETVAMLALVPSASDKSPLDLSTERRAELFRQVAADLEGADPYTHGHSRRVARYASLMALEMGLSQEQADELRTAALLHDVGKLYTPKDILHKPGRLTDEEFAIIKQHPVDGARMIRLLLGDEELASVVLHHHERLDGNGYPSGLSGDLIPLGARIIAVADTFDAITSKRPYRPAMPHKVALDILRHESGAQLDGDAVGAFFAVYHGREPITIAGLAAGVEAVFPSLAGAGVRLAGIAAGTALAAGGLASPLAAQLKAHHALASPTANPFVSLRTPLTPSRTAAGNRNPHTGSIQRNQPQAHAATRSATGSSRATSTGSAATTSRPSAGGTNGETTPSGAKPGNPQGSGGSPSPTHGVSAGGVTVTTGGSGPGVTVSEGGVSAGVTTSVNTNSPGGGVTVGAGGGGSGAGIGGTVSKAGGTGSGSVAGQNVGVTTPLPSLP